MMLLSFPQLATSIVHGSKSYNLPRITHFLVNLRQFSKDHIGQLTLCHTTKDHPRDLEANIHQKVLGRYPR